MTQVHFRKKATFDGGRGTDTLVGSSSNTFDGTNPVKGFETKIDGM